MTTLLLYLPLLLTAGAPQDSAAAAAPRLEWKAIAFASAAGETAEAEEALLDVPERHGRSGSTIRLALVRFRTTATDPAAPLVYLAGGPGNSGIERARQELFPIFQALRSQRDVVVFDQRGTGSSQPSLALAGTLPVLADESIDSPGSRAALAAGARAAAAAVRERGIDLGAYNTAESADDVEAIRVALGVPRLVLWGHSYGSHLALAVLARHPASIERAVLGGVNGLGQRWRLPAEGDAFLSRVGAAVAADPALRAQVPDFLASVRSVLARLRQTPARVEVDGKPVLVGVAELQTLIALRSTDLEFVKALPLSFAQMAAGRFDAVARAVQRQLRERPWGTAMSYAMHLASGVDPGLAARIEAEAASALLGNAINFPFSDPAFAAAWAVPDLGPGFRTEPRSDVPTLFLSGSLDGRTSVADAEKVAAGFSRGIHVVVDGASHDPYTLDPRVAATMLDFLAGREIASRRIAIPVQWRGPEEPRLIGELRETLSTAGPVAAASRLRAMASRADTRLTTYVPGTVAMALLREARRPADARPLLEAAVALFPGDAFLAARLGEACQALGDTACAVAAFGGALAHDPYDRRSAVALKALQAGQ